MYKDYLSSIFSVKFPRQAQFSPRIIITSKYSGRKGISLERGWEDERLGDILGDRRLILGTRSVVKDAPSKSFDLAIRFLFFDKRSLFVRPFSRAQGFIRGEDFPPHSFPFPPFLSPSVFLEGKTAACREGGGDEEGNKKKEGR